MRHELGSQSFLGLCFESVLTRLQDNPTILLLAVTAVEATAQEACMSRNPHNPHVVQKLHLREGISSVQQCCNIQRAPRRHRLPINLPVMHGIISDTSRRMGQANICSLITRLIMANGKPQQPECKAFQGGVCQTGFDSNLGSCWLCDMYHGCNMSSHMLYENIISHQRPPQSGHVR